MVGGGDASHANFFVQAKSQRIFTVSVSDWVSPIFSVFATPPTPLGLSLNHMIMNNYLIKRYLYEQC